MKNLKLFFAFIAFSAVTVASDVTPVGASAVTPTPQIEVTKEEAKSIFVKLKDVVNNQVVANVNNNIVSPADAALAKLDVAFHVYVVKNVNDWVVTPVANRVNQVLARPVTTVAVAAAVYAAYYGYEAYTDSVSKKANSKN